MATYKILFFPRYSNPFDAVPYSEEIDFDAQFIGVAVRRLKKELRSFISSRKYPLADVKGYLLKVNAPGSKRQWTWLKAATFERGTAKIWSLGKKHTENSDPTISYMNMGRRNFR